MATSTVSTVPASTRPTNSATLNIPARITTPLDVQRAHAKRTVPPRVPVYSRRSSACPATARFGYRPGMAGSGKSFDGGPRGAGVYVITGIQASGKSTVAQALAERFARSAHVRGDAFRRFVVGGREEMSPDPSAGAVAQLKLRHRLAAQVADGYAAAGFTAVVQDVVLGEMLPYLIGEIRTDPLYVVVLAPDPAVVERREAGRAKNAYGTFTVADLDAGLRETTPRLGLWLDSSELTVAETVEAILRRAEPVGR
ncbi:hypothetical protein NS2_43930 [Nocardia seriolae NBRC 15557]|nr:hypothetical protein NS2_43930 [Nocardia seriolae NBRC 15557]